MNGEMTHTDERDEQLEEQVERLREAWPLMDAYPRDMVDIPVKHALERKRLRERLFEAVDKLGSDSELEALVVTAEAFADAHKRWLELRESKHRELRWAREDAREAAEID